MLNSVVFSKTSLGKLYSMKIQDSLLAIDQLNESSVFDISSAVDVTEQDDDNNDILLQQQTDSTASVDMERKLVGVLQQQENRELQDVYDEVLCSKIKESSKEHLSFERFCSHLFFVE